MSKQNLNHYETKESINEGVKNTLVETVYESVLHSGKSYYEYLNDIKADEIFDNCDYCTAFIFA